MTGITGLNLSNNHLEELYTIVPLVQTLTSLNALGNKIKHLPIEIGGRTSLKDLQVRASATHRRAWWRCDAPPAPRNARDLVGVSGC